MKRVGFSIASFPSCCQAQVVHSFDTGREDASAPQRADFVGAVTNYGGSMSFAITADHQGDDVVKALEEAGFDKMHTYKAATGSILTAWMFKPEDQEPDDDDDDLL